VACGVGAAELYRLRRCGEYRFVNEHFACGSRHSISKAAYIKLENDIRNFIESERAKADIIDLAVYFRDLRAGPVFGVNENNDFVPASLLKLPMVVTYFNIEEQHPGILETQLLYKEGAPPFVPPLRQRVPPPDELRPGETYSVEELMRRTLAYSDNTAYSLLTEYLNTSFPGGRNRILLTFHELGVIDPRDIADEVASVRGYASIFRALYNVSYLTPEASEKVLNWLVQAQFPDGLSAGMPASVTIANKFGERLLPDGTQQVHDCGIVYFPDNPYLLCVMTKGHDWDRLTGIIAEVSRMVYVEVDSRRRQGGFQGALRGGARLFGGGF
jgi:beta-lactamase class A